MVCGKFIVIEGMEGAGKSSAISVVENMLRHNGIDFINTREPGGTPLAESLRDIVKSAAHQEIITAETELLLMYASRSQLLSNRIIPALKQGLWVIGDRHDLSSRAYQGGGREIDDKVIDTLAQITLKGFKPDFTLYLNVPPNIGLARATARGALDRIEQEQIEFFERVHKKYCQLADADENIITIDATQNIENVHADIAVAVNNFISGSDINININTENK